MLIFHLSLFSLVAASVAFSVQRSEVPTLFNKHKRISVSLANATNSIRDDPAELQKRDGTKYVFMHHIVGNTYPYTQADWADDIRQIQAKGVDALALNIGGDQWQRDQIASAYAAAAALGTNFKLFISFDFTEMGCDVNDIAGRVNQFASHPNQFRVNGKPMISSYSGDCLGNSGWAQLKSLTNGYVMPFIWGLEGQFNNWPSLDSWYCWGCAWPNGNTDKTTGDDQYYLGQLGSRYATTISVWMYTHYSYKNFYQRGDDWLINNRWEQLIAMRDQLTFVEMVTWNDFGESDYYGPIKGAQPDGTTWATGFPHTAWFDMSQYYITAFKTGTYPAITQDVIYFWARPHPAFASASGDGLGKPTGYDWTPDTLWAAVFSTSTSTVTLRCGSSTQTFTNVAAGVTKLQIPLSPGQITVTMVKNGQTVINYTPSDFAFVANPVTYNYNAYVGSAKASGTTAPPATTTTATSTTSTTSASTSTSTSTSTGFTYYGCVAEGTAGSRRALTGASYSQAGMTPQVCQSLCSGYQYAGVEYGDECYCGNSLTNNGATGSVIASSNCNVPCAGDSSQKCGDGWMLSVYSKTTAPPATTTGTGSAYYGCVAEGTTGSRRALTGASYSQAGMTPQVCQSLCSGYKYSGVEYGVECYCGNSLTNNGATGATIPSSNCNMACGGDSSQKCGDAWTLSVYSTSTTSTTNPTAWTSRGCYVDASTRMLRGSFVSQTSMTVDNCINMCSSQGYTMAAAEYGVECYCGSQLFKDSGAGVTANSGDCNMPCSGNSGQTCGAGWRANLYTAPGTVLTRRHKRRSSFNH